MRFSAPIFTYRNILEKAGIKLNIELESKKNEDLIYSESPSDYSEEFSNNTFDKLSLTELKRLLKKAVDDEDYEIAAKIRDEISKR